MLFLFKIVGEWDIIEIGKQLFYRLGTGYSIHRVRFMICGIRQSIPGRRKGLLWQNS